MAYELQQAIADFSLPGALNIVVPGDGYYYALETSTVHQLHVYTFSVAAGWTEVYVRDVEGGATVGTSPMMITDGQYLYIIAQRSGSSLSKGWVYELYDGAVCDEISAGVSPANNLNASGIIGIDNGYLTMVPSQTLMYHTYWNGTVFSAWTYDNYGTGQLGGVVRKDDLLYVLGFNTLYQTYIAVYQMSGTIRGALVDYIQLVSGSGTIDEFCFFDVVGDKIFVSTHGSVTNCKTFYLTFNGSTLTIEDTFSYDAEGLPVSTGTRLWKTWYDGTFVYVYDGNGSIVYAFSINGSNEFVLESSLDISSANLIGAFWGQIDWDKNLIFLAGGDNLSVAKMALNPVVTADPYVGTAPQTVNFTVS